MTKTRLQQRKETIEQLTDLKKREIEENKRLKRKKENLEQTITNHFVINGTIEEMEFELKNIKIETFNKQQKIKKLVNLIVNTVNNIFNYNKQISRLNQLIYMDDDIKFYYWYSKQMYVILPKKKKCNDEPIIDPFLKKIYNNLPNEIIDIIKEYIDFEIQGNLLENKYDPIKMINKFKPKQIKEFINKIYISKGIDSYSLETKDIIIHKFDTFYNCSYNDDIVLRIKRNITDERLFLKNIILSFKPKDQEILFELYKFIIIIYKIRFGLP